MYMWEDMKFTYGKGPTEAKKMRNGNLPTLITLWKRPDRKFQTHILGSEITLQKSPDSAKIAYFIFALKGKFRAPVVISLYLRVSLN